MKSDRIKFPAGFWAGIPKPELGIDSPIIRFLVVSPKARGHGM